MTARGWYTNPSATAPDQDRLDRQLRIPDWDQAALARARLGVVGDDDLLTPLFLLSAAALGLNQVRVAAPRLDQRFIALARQLNPAWQLSHFPGYYSHPLCLDIFQGCHLIVDLSRAGLADKILLEQAFQQQFAVLRGLSWQTGQEQGFSLFTYLPGREWLELQEMLFPVNLPGRPGSTDAVLDIIAAGLILEETKNIIRRGPVSPAVVSYRSPRWARPGRPPAIGIVGAGALGNFVGLGLALAGFPRMTLIDPDAIEVTNLNRQVFFAGAVGKGKAATLAARLNQEFGTQAASVSDYFSPDRDVSGFDLIFDCVDNFATRIIISQACVAAGKILVSGGSHVAAGQVVAYHPEIQSQAPADLLGLEAVVSRRPPAARQRAACVYQPDPAVIMTNQIIGGFMVEAGRKLLAGVAAPPLFYEAGAVAKIFQAGED